MNTSTQICIYIKEFFKTNFTFPITSEAIRSKHINFQTISKTAKLRPSSAAQRSDGEIRVCLIKVCLLLKQNYGNGSLNYRNDSLHSFKIKQQVSLSNLRDESEALGRGFWGRGVLEFHSLKVIWGGLHFSGPPPPNLVLKDRPPNSQHFEGMLLPTASITLL